MGTLAADVEVVRPETGEARTVEDQLKGSAVYEVECAAGEAATEYDALVVPGGIVGSETRRADDETVELLREHVAAGEPIAVTCHGPWPVVEDVVDRRTSILDPSLRTDVETRVASGSTMMSSPTAIS